MQQILGILTCSQRGKHALYMFSLKKKKILERLLQTILLEFYSDGYKVLKYFICIWTVVREVTEMKPVTANWEMYN